MPTKRQKIHAIIHIATATAGGIGAGLAQLPGADMPVLTALQAAMIIAIGHEHGCEITKANAKSILLTFPGSFGGRALSQLLVGWIPGYGNCLKAGTAMAITETIGWTADAYFATDDFKKQPASNS